MRIGVLTGGGDCPGLNAVIRAVVRTCDARYGSSVVGFLDGWRGLLGRGPTWKSTWSRITAGFGAFLESLVGAGAACVW